MITKVEINEAIQKQLDKDIKFGFFSPDIRDLIAFWRIEIQEIGFEDYLISPLAKTLEDHKLKGKRQDQRSIVLNSSGGRLIYKYYKNKIIVKVIKISHDHNYD